MAFVIKQTDTYSWPVSFETPGDGKRTKQTFEALFRRYGVAKTSELQATLAGLEGLDIDKAAKAAIGVVTELVAGWEGITDADGEPFPFNAANLRALLDINGVMPAIVRAWSESLVGAPEKN